MLRFIQNNREGTALLAILALFALLGVIDSNYFTLQTFTMIFSSAQILILLAIGATMVMLTRNIDVSVGSITGLCAVTVGMALNAAAIVFIDYLSDGNNTMVTANVAAHVHGNNITVFILFSHRRPALGHLRYFSTRE